MNYREMLKSRIDELSPTAIRFVARMVDSVSSPPTVHTGENAPRALSVHHGSGLEDACESAGFRVKPIIASRRKCGSITEIENPSIRLEDIAIIPRIHDCRGCDRDVTGFS